MYLLTKCLYNNFNFSNTKCVGYFLAARGETSCVIELYIYRIYNYIVQNERNDQLKIALKLTSESTGNTGRNVGKLIILIKDSPAHCFFLAKSFK